MLMNIPEKNTESNSEKKPENSVQHSWLDLLLTNLNRENGVMKRFCEDRKNDFGDFCKWIFTKDRICNSCNFQRRFLFIARPRRLKKLIVHFQNFRKKTLTFIQRIACPNPW